MSVLNFTSVKRRRVYRVVFGSSSAGSVSTFTLMDV